MFWVLRCIVAVGAIYWFSPLRTEQAASASRSEWHAVARAVREHPDVAGALAREAASSVLSTVASAARRPGNGAADPGLASHPARAYMSPDASSNDTAVRR
jgi:hypothetical protein